MNKKLKFINDSAAPSKSVVMGVLNATPDSFSDGGEYMSLSKALTRCAEMVDAGAAIIDVGGESTRPGAPLVDVQQELDRVVPVIEAIASRFDVVISVDTSKPQVMQHAVDSGAELINDVRALQEPGALETAVRCDVPVCLMHMQGSPQSMQNNPTYKDIVEEVQTFLMQRVDACLNAGINKDNLILDPGFGFGKSLAHNYQLLAALPKIRQLGYPILVGMSRKSMIGQVLKNQVNERLAGSLALATFAAQAKSEIIRVHDVKETVDVVEIVNAYHVYTQQGEQ
ncbi:dihydropteroate synthase [Salinimonas chungwhensis]|uniref:dihydropteroate synthase n=1 Tax=Salinimonas chungwhensis TaxID=265425 RepID=UPI0003748EB3|nr:dihydropteroate synthase [Salinimonas chungwhensis]